MPAGTTRNARGIIHRAADDKQVTVLIGLDLSTAFDTVDDRLRLEFGMTWVSRNERPGTLASGK